MIRTRYACNPIPLDRNRIYYLTQPQLVEANKESIRLGMSRNLIERKIARLPVHFKFSVLEAWDHTSREGLKNIRLVILVGPNVRDPQDCCLDVTADTWARIKQNWAPTKRRR